MAIPKNRSGLSSPMPRPYTACASKETVPIFVSAKIGLSLSWGRSCWIAAIVAIGCVICVESKAEMERPTNPREMFRDLGVGDNYFDQLADGSPLDPTENNTLLRVLFRLRSFPATDMKQWALKAQKLPEAVEQPNEFRGSIFRLRGRVLEVEPMAPSAELAQRYELTAYFRCRLQLDGSDQFAEIYTENVPKAWRKGAKPNAPSGVLGVFLKIADPTTLVFAAPRLAWYPNDLLGRLGMDVGLLDDVQNQEPITAAERNAFYGMLDAVGRAKPGQLLRQAEANLPKIHDGRRWTTRGGQEAYSVVPLFNEPDTQRGRLVALSGVTRRIEKIHVNEPDIVARFGIDHYYQVSLFTDDSQGNPLTFCVRELPEGMPFGNLPQYAESVRIAGFFFKSWSYRVPRVTDPTLPPGSPKRQYQLSPLLIGRSLDWYPAPTKPTENPSSNYVIIGLFLLVVAIIWIVGWQARRREKRWIDHAVGGSPKFDEGINLEHVDRRSNGGLDFSRIAEMDHGPRKKHPSDQEQQPGSDI